MSTKVYTLFLGTLLTLYLPCWFEITLIPIAGIMLLITWYFKQGITTYIFIFLVGLIIPAFILNQTYGQLSGEHSIKQDYLMRGWVSSLPEQMHYQSSFNFTGEEICYQSTCRQEKLFLRVYLSENLHLPVQIGEKWQLKVRLKFLHGNANLGSDDGLKKWVHDKIQATATVKKSRDNLRLEPANIYSEIKKIRFTIFQKIIKELKWSEMSGLVSALSIGLTGNVTQQQWDVFRKTGTTHLLAISGLHLGLISGLLFILVKRVWNFLGLSIFIPSQIAAASSAILGASIYSALAGFSTSTQRALVMIALLMISLIYRQKIFPSHTLGCALGFVLLLDPFAAFSTSFWLSFTAVFIIFYLMHQRAHPAGVWWKFCRMQCLLGVGMFPVSWFFFGQASTVGFIANFIAIPWIGYFVVPLCLLGSILSIIDSDSGIWFWSIGASLLEMAYHFLEKCSALSWSIWSENISNGWIACSAFIGVAWLLAPRPFPGRHCSFILILPIFLYQPSLLNKGTLMVDILDVGQGLSVVLSTRNHRLIYDTGPNFFSGHDAGTSVILPYLKQLNSQLDKMVISHGDLDHRGGAMSILTAIKVKQLETSAPEKFPNHDSQICEKGTSWIWDGVKFEYLYPTHELLGLNNNSSCVLKVSSGNHSILLTGDIEKLAENWLLENAPDLLQSDVLVVPHHGSKTSSSLAFIKAVKPQYAIFSTGFQNRFGFPNEVVMNRYKTEGAHLLNTPDSGMVRFILNPNQPVANPYRHRLDSGPWWRKVYF